MWIINWQQIKKIRSAVPEQRHLADLTELITELEKEFPNPTQYFQFVMYTYP